MSSTIKDSFETAFHNKIRAEKEPNVKNESDSDSAEEYASREQKRKQRKRPRGHRVKRKKPSFTVNTVPKHVSIKEFPTVKAMEDVEKNSAECIEAETNFFTSKNELKPVTTNHLRPWDFPWLRLFLQKPATDTFDIHQMNNLEKMRADIPSVSRKHEERYLCEPTGKERQCLKGTDCEGTRVDSEHAFIVREYLLPEEEEEYNRTGKYKQDIGLCLLCTRNDICRAYFHTRAEGKSMSEDAVLQHYRNIVGVEGEYCIGDTVCSSRHSYDGLIAPIVLHKLSAYRLVKKDGKRYYEQWRMAYPFFEKAP